MASTSKNELKSETRLNALDNFKSLQGKLNPQNGSARDPSLSLTEKSVSAEKTHRTFSTRPNKDWKPAGDSQD